LAITAPEVVDGGRFGTGGGCPAGNSLKKGMSGEEGISGGGGGGGVSGGGAESSGNKGWWRILLVSLRMRN